MTTFQDHTRYAVEAPQGLVCKNTGRDWRTGLPGYSFTAIGKHALLYATKGAATKCAAIVGGVVIPVVIQANPA